MPDVNGMMAQVARTKSEAKAIAAKSADAADELPADVAPLDDSEETPLPPAKPEPVPEEVEEPAPAIAAQAKKVRIGDREFDTQEAALEYAEKLEGDKLASDAYAQGIQDALSRIPGNVTPTAAPAPVAEDNFDTEFYTNPKEYLARERTRARDEALAVIRIEQTREQLWAKFFTEHPDLDGQRDLCELVYTQNSGILANMDFEKGSKLLATKVRTRFQDWEDRKKPRTELPNVTGKVSGGSSVAPQNVTQQKKNDTPLDFAAQLRSLNRRA
jgi:hypothetical protein